MRSHSTLSLWRSAYLQQIREGMISGTAITVDAGTTA
jgi:hypothetical protein